MSAPWLPLFPWPLADAISGIDCIWQDGKLDLSPGYSEKKRPPKGECLQCASVTLLRPAGRWRGDTEGERGQKGDEVHGADAVFVAGFGRKY